MIQIHKTLLEGPVAVVLERPHLTPAQPLLEQLIQVVVAVEVVKVREIPAQAALALSLLKYLTT
jgi:hypothetical protein